MSLNNTNIKMDFVKFLSFEMKIHILSFDHRFVKRNGKLIMINKIPKNDKRFKLLKGIPIINKCIVTFKKKKNGYTYSLQLIISDDTSEYEFMFDKSKKCIHEDGFRYTSMNIISKYKLI